MDDLEIQIVAGGGFEKSPERRHRRRAVGTVYLVGDVVGAQHFGRLTDTLDRKKLLTLTFAFVRRGLRPGRHAPNMWILVLRFVPGIGIGGEANAWISPRGRTSVARPRKSRQLPRA